MDSPPLRLNLFGSPTVQQGGTVHALALERRSQLCVLLALRRGWVPRAEVAQLLWPQQENKLALTNLRKTLFRLPGLPWAPAVESHAAGALRFEPATDVIDFEAALREQRGDAALALYRGELLAGFDDGQSDAWTRWIGFERERLRAAWRGVALAQLGDEQLDGGTAIALATRLLEDDPLDEAALRALMQWQQRLGQAGAARAAYRAFVERLRSELGIEPGAELRALNDAAGVPAVVVPAPREAADDGFVGRSVECQRIAALLARAECRLLCLIGPGGVGKTRLARRTMALVAPTFADGGVFVELEDATTPAQFGGTLARALGAGRVRGDDALARAIEALRGQQALLVLDNFEQLAEHAALIERLLQACPRIKLLVTSRVRLTVADEWSMPVEGLPWPDPEDEDRAEAFDAVRLFVKAAQRVEPAFAAAAEQGAIVEICRQVEGLPLAIELAAAWVRLLPCAAIAAELRHGSELLRARDAAHPERHASIEQVFEQSWQRLSASERDTLARLSVFRGGFTAEAARAVAGASLPVLGALSDKSLLRKEGARLHLHPLVQQLAAGKLAAQGGVPDTHGAHAEHTLRWMAQQRPAIEDGRRDALQALDGEFENCRVAWLHAASAGRLDVLRASARVLLNYCDYRGRFDDGMALLGHAIGAPSCQSDPTLVATLQAQLAHIEYRIDRYAQAQARAEQALAALQGAPAREAQCQALTVLGSCALQTGRLADARRLYKRALTLAPPDALAHNRAAVLGNLALVEKRLGHYPEALRLHVESLAQHRRIGDSAGVALCLNNLGTMYMLLHEWDAAAVQLAECLAIAERDGLVAIQSYARSNLADVALQRGDLDGAAAHIERGLELARSAANRATEFSLQMQRARIAVRRGDLAGARDALAQGLAGATAIGMPTLQSDGVLCFAELLEAQGHAGVARRVLALAIDHPGTLPADRDVLRAERARRVSPAVAEPPWTGIGLEELLQRIVAERDVAHAPLIAKLGAGD